MKNSRSLFDDLPTPELRGTPLAERMRPRNLDEVLGQQEVIGEGGFLRRAIAQDRVPSLIFWGPPGSGKTTLAKIIAAETTSYFLPFSAVTSGIKEIKQVMADAARLRQTQGRRVLLFIDEIHRFNRAQQDAFLPYVEKGEIVLVGATTENPSFELNSALLSRCRVVVLSPLERGDLITLLERALEDRERGLARLGIEVGEDALEFMAQFASGDARKALNLLELSVADCAAEDRETADLELVKKVAQRKMLLYDKSGEEHFNLISALHKSVRESDPDAALYWLVRMLEGGEDPLYVARRLVRMANEDVGLADPRAVEHALAAWEVYRRLGSPEGELVLAQATLYLALAPKSTAVYEAFEEARRSVDERPAEPVPLVLRNAPTGLMKKFGYGRDYVYAPHTEEGVGGLECLPESLRGTRFYRPKGEGFEAELLRRLEKVGRLREEARKRRQ